ncbi:hypothetical protein BO78DRAFT_429049 [Aspergillus sclerotiicarbonarius CBS 121057]|uniref:Heterokaryon incompatibility domain-containing protein n=1 Tax=Aspergillus sclerotiicarbonarius (strain CBS 121057 / IBT 28362) TaxID=1448318 RepID=A0A319EAT5_ASPSB|nr:hypothetical protein BO78DRAFT_429049 [Aspergillus sclerotiicarbonarius CBS 121057]
MTSMYAEYNTPDGTFFWTRRLSILIGDGSDTDTSQSKDLYQAFQPCDIDATTVFVDGRFVDPRPEVDMMMFAGRRRPLQLDLSWVHRWIKKPTQLDPFPIGNPISRAELCLGGPQTFQLEKSTIIQLAQPGSLAAGALPQTIEDALSLTESLGFERIWIDALCIVQDSPDDKAAQIPAMSQIYGFATFTIVAAAGPNVNSGLPGLHPGTRFLEQKEVIVRPYGELPGFSLMTTLQPLGDNGHHYLEGTDWNSRGWTMQERTLSRRVLVFTREQVYWACRKASWYEESYFENSSLQCHRFHETALELSLRRSSRNRYQPEGSQPQLWRIYQTLVTNYTRRNFTYDGDVFDGFSAITQGLSSLSGEDFLWGLPRSHFEQSLLWSSFTGQRRRLEKSTLPMTSLPDHVYFPSWSWMGWVGETFICIGDERFDTDLGEIPEILCYEHIHSPLSLRRVRPTPAQYELAHQRSLPTWKHHENQPVTLSDLSQSQIPLDLNQTPDTLYLIFWTSSARFTLRPRTTSPIYQSDIVDSNGIIIGETGKTLLHTVNETQPQPQPQTKTSHEFIVLASRRNQFTTPTLLTLQIKWRAGIAYRINYAEIDEDAWIRASPVWKLVVLG